MIQPSNQENQVRNGPYRLQRSAKHNDRTSELLGKNRNCQHLSYDGAFAELSRAVLPLGGAIRHKASSIRRARACDHRTGICARRRTRSLRTSASARMSAVTDEQNEALENWQAASCFNETQRAALAFTDEIVKLHKPTTRPSTRSAPRLTPAADRAAALGRLLHHDVEISGNLCHRHAPVTEWIS
jgi:hypothetical protein